MWAAILEVALLWSTVGWDRVMLLDAYILVQAFFTSGSLFILAEIDTYPEDYASLSEQAQDPVEVPEPQDLAEASR